MQLLATSPEVAFDARYPAEYRFWSYFVRVSEMMTQKWDPERHPGVTRFFFDHDRRFGPVPFESELLEVAELRGPVLAGMWHGFSEVLRRHQPQVSYYAEKLAVPVDDLVTCVVRVRLIDVVRDPRDVLCSIRDFTAGGLGEDGFGAASETRSESYLRDFTLRIRQQFEAMRSTAAAIDRVTVRYEDLATQLHDVAETLSAHLGVELDAGQVVRQRERYRHHMTSPSVEESVGRWKGDLAESDAEFLTTELAGHLGEFGYV